MKLITRLCFILFSINFSQPMTADEEVEIQTTNRAEHIFGNGYQVVLKLDPEHATVGQLAKVSGAVTKNNQPVEDVMMTLSFHHIEDGADNYKSSFFSSKGTFSVKHQFFDGAAHQITLDVAPLKEGMWEAQKVTMNIDVEGIQPPKNVLFKTLALLLTVTAIGMFLGFKIGHRIY